MEIAFYFRKYAIAHYFGIFFGILASMPAWANHPAQKKVTIQLGAFYSLHEATQLRSALGKIKGVKIEKKPKTEKERAIYRVTVGKFSTQAAATQFMNKHRLKERYLGAWIRTSEMDRTLAQEPEIPEEPHEKKAPEDKPIREKPLSVNPYLLQLTLQCEEGKTHGVYRTELKPDEKSEHRDLDVNIHWNCISNSVDRWLAKDEERSPSHFSLAPIFGAGSLNMTDSILGVMNRTDLSYGAQITAFRSFGGMGPTLEYRLLNHSYSGDQNVISPIPFMTHRILVGARLPLSHRIEFQPVFGFSNQGFLQGADVATATLVDPILFQVGLRGTFHLLELSDRTWFDLGGGYQYILPQTTTLGSFSGSEWSFRIQTSHFDPGPWGMNWFFEYSNRTVGTASFSQNDTIFLLGVSVLLSY